MTVDDSLRENEKESKGKYGARFENLNILESIRSGESSECSGCQLDLVGIFRSVIDGRRI